MVFSLKGEKSDCTSKGQWWNRLQWESGKTNPKEGRNEQTNLGDLYSVGSSSHARYHGRAKVGHAHSDLDVFCK